jgi:hypothetical protein
MGRGEASWDGTGICVSGYGRSGMLMEEALIAGDECAWRNHGVINAIVILLEAITRRICLSQRRR